ncbi:MAG: polysaccharide biosynthesis/export family protein [Nitrospiria bacterium]
MGRSIIMVVFTVSFLLSACGVIRVLPKGQESRTQAKPVILENDKMVASISPSLPPVSLDAEGVDYILGAEDLIEVMVWKNPDLSSTVFVRPDGKISLPLIGDLQAAGLTSIELRDSIKVLLRRYKKTPEVSVIVREINSFSIFFVGEVAQPGKIQLKSETSFLQAVTMVGGFTEFANVKKIVLLRRENGQERRIRINYNDIISGKSSDSNVMLKRGDTILVP